MGEHEPGHTRTTADQRRRLGVYYTPQPVAEGLARIGLAKLDAGARVADPSCGDGAFLVAAAEELRRKGGSVERIVAEQLFGADIDAQAVQAATRRIADWAALHTGIGHLVPQEHLVVADFLSEQAETTWIGNQRPLDAVVGNPPFGSQLRSITVRSHVRQVDVAKRLGIGALGYVDTAGLFLVRALDLVRSGGTVTLVLPTSLLAARDAATVRAAASEQAGLVAVWAGGDDIGFDAAVSVWAPVLEVGTEQAEVTEVVRYQGARVEFCDRRRVRSGPDVWARSLTDLIGGFDPGELGDLRSSGLTLGEVATTTAGFRRHFYGLAPYVHEESGHPGDAAMLVTTGAIDPLHHRSSTALRFAGRRFQRPIVDVEGLRFGAADLAAWVDSVSVPKVLVASQGKVIESVIDPRGHLVPSTPVIAVIPRPGADVSVAHLGAVLSSPIATAMLHARAAGTGMARGQCRVSAALLGTLALPSDRAAWDDGAAAAIEATRASTACDADGWERALDRLGESMTAAFGLDVQHRVVRWWRDQRPPWRGARRLHR